MPVHKVDGGYRWGRHGKTYPTRAQAQRQARAIYASGYASDADYHRPTSIDLGAYGVWAVCWDYDMPYLAGSSLKLRTIYVQRGWDPRWGWRGRVFDRLHCLCLHEACEKHWLDLGLPYEGAAHDGAHDRATAMENAAARAEGMPVGPYQRSYAHDLRWAWMLSAARAPGYKTPPGLEPLPYEHPHSRAQREALAEVLAQDGRPALRTGGKDHEGKPAAPSAALAAEYKRRLDALVGEMQASYERWVPAAYRKHEPATVALAQDATLVSVALDASAPRELNRIMRGLARRWEKRFDEGAEQLAAWFATRSVGRSDEQLRRLLRDAGISVKMRWTRAMQDAKQAVVAENVGLIRSIPRQYHEQVQGMVMRSVAAGRDLSELSTDLRERYGVTKRRAELIARDQNNKASADLGRVRRLELGIKEAVWVHSGGGKHPRASHVEAGRAKTRYSVADGWYDPEEGAHVHPGQLVGCRCISRPIIPGIEE